MSDEPIAFTAEGRPLYDNAATVVAVAIRYKDCILAIRRNTNPGMGKLALPGGFQMRGETWQQAGAREVFEEIGLHINPYDLNILSLTTDEYHHNVVIAYYHLKSTKLLTELLDINWDEVQSVVTTTPISGDPEDWAFPVHYRGMIDAFR